LDCTNWSGLPPSILVDMAPLLACTLLACILFSKAWRRGEPQSDGDGERQKENETKKELRTNRLDNQRSFFVAG
jgi:hypothetical protein